jgi:hypothetical protein
MDEMSTISDIPGTPLINTSLQRGDRRRIGGINRFSGFHELRTTRSICQLCNPRTLW